MICPKCSDVMIWYSTDEKDVWFCPKCELRAERPKGSSVIFYNRALSIEEAERARLTTGLDFDGVDDYVEV